MLNLITAQYTLVQSARGALLDYCTTLTEADFVAPVAVFNSSSLRDLLVHIANCYRHWLGKVAMAQPLSYYQPSHVADVEATRQIFREVDALVAAYCAAIGFDWQVPTKATVSGRSEPLLITPLEFFTHVVTHEFHHKGQLLSMSRQLGYTPVDTDIIRY